MVATLSRYILKYAYGSTSAWSFSSSVINSGCLCLWVVVPANVTRIQNNGWVLHLQAQTQKRDITGFLTFNTELASISITDTAIIISIWRTTIAWNSLHFTMNLLGTFAFEKLAQILALCYFRLNFTGSAAMIISVIKKVRDNNIAIWVIHHRQIYY